MLKKPTSLKPIERTERKLFNTWAGSIHYLLDLKTKKSTLLSQLQNECLALWQQSTPPKDTQDIRNKLQNIHVSANLCLKMQVQADTIDKIMGFTGFED